MKPLHFKHCMTHPVAPLSKSIQDQRHTAGQQSATQYGRTKIDDGVRTAGGLGAFPEVSNPTLNHEN